jgi:hypothetical protein
MIFTDPEAELLQHTAELLTRLAARHVDDKDIEDAEVTADQIRYLLEAREKRRLRGMPIIPAGQAT